MHTFEKKVIFVVDDDKVFLKILQRHLELKNLFQVHAFESGERCLEQLSLQPEIIILDYHLNHSGGDLNGQQTLEAIQKSDYRPKVIMLSGQEDGELVLELIRQGVRDYIVKSANALAELDEILDDYLEQGR